jgi:xylulokinase
MYLLGFDIGSSSVKASIIEVKTGTLLSSAFFPKQEMKITAVKSGWAEQEPEVWWDYLKQATQQILSESAINKNEIKAIGISYQMHGLVAIDKDKKVVRPSIIWCDSRAVKTGEKAFNEIGEEKCLEHLLNSPGNFTASKLKWVKENEPDIYAKIWKIMLPGDYINMMLSGDVNTTVSGLSEGMLWDFKTGDVADILLQHYDIDKELIPEIAPNFQVQSKVNKKAAEELGIPEGTPIAYRAGDQPNNAFSLNVLNPGEIAATAGTSGVVYGVSDVVKFDPQSRVNTFAHVNHTDQHNRLGVLLCVNGTGILNSWMKHNVGGGSIDYPEMNNLAEKVPIGSDGLIIMPFGNGAERLLKNQDPGSSFHNLNFNIHNANHLYRAAQEGIVFAFHYGIEIMQNIGINAKVIRAGNANMFLSPVFRETLAGITGATIELYDTDGAVGAAKGAGVGAGIYQSFEEAFSTLKKMQTIEPDQSNAASYKKAYEQWKNYIK